MQIGMVWFDNDKKKPLEERLARGAAYYKDKYGIAPDVCFVNEKEFPGELDELEMDDVVFDGVRVLPINETIATSIPVGYMWLGVTDNKVSDTVYNIRGQNAQPKHRIS